MYQDSKRTCTAIVLLIKPFVSRRCRCRCRRGFVNSLLRRQRQRERRQTKGLMSRTMAVHVRCKVLYISLPFSVKQQLEMTKFCVFWRT